MRANLIESNKPQKFIHSVRNSESTVDIPAGTPLILNLSGTPQPSTYQNGLPAGVEDGLQVILPSSGSAWAARFYHYGVAIGIIKNGQIGGAQVHGVVSQALVLVNTRSASTASWSQVASSAASLLLSIDTVRNVYGIAASTIGGTASSDSSFILTRGDVAQAVLIDSIASQAATATSDATTDTRTVITALKRVFLRQM